MPLFGGAGEAVADGAECLGLDTHWHLDLFAGLGLWSYGWFLSGAFLPVDFGGEVLEFDQAVVEESAFDDLVESVGRDEAVD